MVVPAADVPCPPGHTLSAHRHDRSDHSRHPSTGCSALLRTQVPGVRPCLRGAGQALLPRSRFRSTRSLMGPSGREAPPRPTPRGLRKAHPAVFAPAPHLVNAAAASPGCRFAALSAVDFHSGQQILTMNQEYSGRPGAPESDDPHAFGAQLRPARRYPGIHPAPCRTQEVDAGRVTSREGQEFREDSNEALLQSAVARVRA